MSNPMEYKGYAGSVEYSPEDNLLFGRLVGIRDRILFDGDDLKTLQANFRGAVDEYLAYCEVEGKKPDQPFRGTFQVRLKGDLHRRLAMYAEQKHQTINAATNEAIERLLTDVA